MFFLLKPTVSLQLCIKIHATNFFLQKQKLYLRGCPWCCVCDQRIETAKCYVVEPDEKMESCVCNNCMEKQLEAVKKVITPYLFERLTEFVEYELEQTTPHDPDY